jgi:DNA-binding PadR family transcriptional regulator
MSGYDLMKAFNSSVSFFWHAQTSQIYLELNKLEKKGFVEAEYIMQSERPNKKIFTVTAEGKNEFLNWLSGDSQLLHGMKNDFLMKVFFSGNVSSEKSIAMLKKFEEECRQYLKAMEKVPQNIEDYKKNLEQDTILYWWFTADFGNCYISMCIDWAGRCIKKLEAIR